MKFIEKYARVEESDDGMEDDADGDEVSECEVLFQISLLSKCWSPFLNK